jgi:hypothetical protein
VAKQRKPAQISFHLKRDRCPWNLDLQRRVAGTVTRQNPNFENAGQGNRQLRNGLRSDFYCAIVFMVAWSRRDAFDIQQNPAESLAGF